MDEDLDEVLDDEEDPIGTEEESEPEDPGDEEETDVIEEGDLPETDWSETIADGSARPQQHFTAQPVPPYYIGDDWDDDGDLYICVQDSGQTYDADDWVPVVDTEATPQTQVVTRYVIEEITDYSSAKLAEYEDSGATAWAIYDDGTRTQVQWSQVVEPVIPLDVAADEALEVALANGQHFWHNDSDASTHGGAGVHVTDQTQEDWDDAVADGFSDASANKPYHNVLINALGILLRTALSNLVAITRSAISFFDGSGNNSSNITASFGASSAQIGKSSGKHVTIDSNGTSIYDGSTQLAQYGSNIRLAPASDSAIVSFCHDYVKVSGSTSTNHAEGIIYSEQYKKNRGEEVVDVVGDHPTSQLRLGTTSYHTSSLNYDFFSIVDLSARADNSTPESGIQAKSEVTNGLTVAYSMLYCGKDPTGLAKSAVTVKYYDSSATGEIDLAADEVIAPGTLKLTRTQDASGTANNQPALMIGAETGQHLELDGNEIMSKASAMSTGTLNVNLDGGLVVVGPSGLRTTGKLMVRDEDVTAGTAPADTTYIQTVEVQASGGTVIGHDEYVAYDTGMIGHNFAAVRQSVNGTMTWYQARMMVDSSGTVSYYVPGAAAFRSAISAASDSHTHAAVKSSATSQITMESGRTLNSIYTAKAAGSVLTVMISFKPTSNLTSGTTYDVGTLASGLRPYGASFNASTGMSSVDDAWITTGGVVKYRPGANRASGTTLQVNATYVVA